jgi:hypothetical protein
MISTTDRELSKDASTEHLENLNILYCALQALLKIQEQIIRRCAGGSSCDILRNLKIELVEAKEGAAEHLLTAHEALRPIHTEMDKCRLLRSDESVAKLNELSYRPRWPRHRKGAKDPKARRKASA